MTRPANKSSTRKDCRAPVLRSPRRISPPGWAVATYQQRYEALERVKGAVDTAVMRKTGTTPDLKALEESMRPARAKSAEGRGAW